LTPALAQAQSAPVCLESRGARDAAYSAKPVAAPGCVQPARYDVSIVDGCVGIYGATSLSARGGAVVATGPDWVATVDVSGDAPVVTPDCAGAAPATLSPVSSLETGSVAARAALLDDHRPDVRAAALEATARDQRDPAACDALSAFLRDAPSYGFARAADARRARSLAHRGCLDGVVAEPSVEPTPDPLPLSDGADGADLDAPTAAVASSQDAPRGPNEPGGMGYSFNVGMLMGDPTLGPDPAISMWGGLKLFPEDEEWGTFFAPGVQLTFADTRVEVVPTLRLGMAYALTAELEGGPDAVARTFTAFEGYALLGVKPPIGSRDVGLRVGVGVASPLGLIVSIASLGELGFPLPNGVELLVDQDLVTSRRTTRLNLTVGF
jgi:hypothetical protein